MHIASNPNITVVELDDPVDGNDPAAALVVVGTTAPEPSSAVVDVGTMAFPLALVVVDASVVVVAAAVVVVAAAVVVVASAVVVVTAHGPWLRLKLPIESKRVPTGNVMVALIGCPLAGAGMSR